jgi:peptidoglycan DL-endopeptidase CwlO
VQTPPAVHKALRYPAVTAVTAGLAALAMLVGTGGIAAATPSLTVAQVQKKLSALTSKADRLDQQYDQVQQELGSASQRLKVVNAEAARYAVQFKAMRSQVGQLAAQAYEEGNLNSSLALLTAGDPQQILNQSSILEELSSQNTAEMGQFLAAAKQLTSTQAAARHTRAGIVALKRSLAQRKATLNKLIAKEKTLLAALTPAQREPAAPGGGGTGTGGGTGGGGGTIGGHDPLPTATQGEKAVQFAYDQLNCPYVWGGTGPCHDGFDCSGLTMEAWAAAGVSIPRTSYEQWDDLTHVNTNDLQPGDILVFNGASHVGIYVGGGDLIDAPQTGMDIEKVPLAGWYEENLDGAVAP